MKKNIKILFLIKVGIIVSFLLVFVGFSGKYFTGTTAAGQAGGSALAAPTNVTASDNVYSNKVGLYWDTIRGATNYRIFRNLINNPATASDVGVTPGKFLSGYHGHRWADVFLLGKGRERHGA